MAGNSEMAYMQLHRISQKRKSCIPSALAGQPTHFHVSSAAEQEAVHAYCQISGPLGMSLADFLFDAARNGDDIEIVVDQDSEANPYYTSQTIAASMGSVPSSSKTTFKWQLSWVYEANSGKVQFFVLKSGKSIINKSHRHEVALSFGRYNDATKKQSLATWYHIKPKEMFEFHVWILDGEEKRHVQSLAGSRRVLRLARVINSVIEELRRVRGIQQAARRA
ncbi:hypothetical protein LTR79_010481 [Exophiala xenobiotica]|nr:hypothetical protein LTR79_010481 [Exophiala xenobiotica]